MEDLRKLLEYRITKFASLIRDEDLSRMREDAETMKVELASLELQKKDIENRMGELRASQQRLIAFLEKLQ
jgi:chaperonin cofactor prefoldin